MAQTSKPAITKAVLLPQSCHACPTAWLTFVPAPQPPLLLLNVHAEGTCQPAKAPAQQNGQSRASHTHTWQATTVGAVQRKACCQVALSSRVKYAGHACSFSGKDRSSQIHHAALAPHQYRRPRKSPPRGRRRPSRRCCSQLAQSAAVTAPPPGGGAHASLIGGCAWSSRLGPVAAEPAGTSDAAPASPASWLPLGAPPACPETAGVASAEAAAASCWRHCAGTGG